MRESLITFWRRDLAERLVAGADRTSFDPSGGALWLSRWAWVAFIVALTLYASGGYEAGFLRINAAASAYPAWMWEWLTVLGDARVPFALALLITLRYPRLFWALIIAALVAAAYSRGLKELLDTTRPPGVLAADSFNLIGPSHRRASFPSGHTVTAGVFFGVLIYYTPRVTLRTLLTVLAVLAGLSRVAVGVHWPIDVAAGLLGAALAAWAGVRLAERWPKPANDLRVHLVLVTLGSILVMSLLFDDAGYHLAATPMAILGAASLGVVLVQYVIRPVLRYRRRQGVAATTAPKRLGATK